MRSGPSSTPSVPPEWWDGRWGRTEGDALRQAEISAISCSKMLCAFAFGSRRPEGREEKPALRECAGRRSAPSGRSCVTAEGTPLASTSLGPGGRQGWERDARSGTRGFWRLLGASGGGGVPSPGSDQDKLAGPPCHCPSSLEWFSPVIHLGLVLSLPLGSSRALGPCPLGSVPSSPSSMRASSPWERRGFGPGPGREG